jgi:hypothetical protein
VCNDLQIKVVQIKENTRGTLAIAIIEVDKEKYEKLIENQRINIG